MSHQHYIRKGLKGLKYSWTECTEMCKHIYVFEKEINFVYKYCDVIKNLNNERLLKK